MNILLWILFGALVGYIAKRITGTSLDTFTTIIVGIVGSALGGFITDALNIGNQAAPNGFNIISIIVGVLGSILLLWIVSKFTGRKI